MAVTGAAPGGLKMNHNYYLMLSRALCNSCQSLTPHRTLYIRGWSGTSRTWKEVFLTCTVCSTPYHIIRTTYEALKHSEDPKFDRILRQAATPVDVNTLRKRLAEEGAPYTESGLLDALAYLKQNGYISTEETDHTQNVINHVKIIKNLAKCDACRKNSVIVLYAMRNRRFTPAGALCVSCGATKIVDISAGPENWLRWKLD
jgi:hypothetical protein